MSSFGNFVQCRVVAPLAIGATAADLFAATAPYTLPPESGGLLVLVDSPGNPSFIEVIRYTARSGLQLQGITRGVEGTVARAWTGTVYAFQSLMAEEYQTLVTAVAAKQASHANLSALSGLTGAADRVPYFTGAGALSLATLTAKSRSLLASADEPAMRTFLGLGSAATTDATAYATAAQGTKADGAVQPPASDGKQYAYKDGSWIEVQSGSPLGSVSWWPLRSSIQAGDAAGDGQVLNRATYPSLWAALNNGLLPMVTDTVWLSDATKRGCYSSGDGSTTFRLPDYNGKSAGSLGAPFLRGDGALSAAVAGVIQRDALQNITAGLGTTAPYVGTVSGAAVASGESISAVASGGMAALQALTFDASRVVRTASETRPLNVTGCWVIKLFGAVTNVGSADAAQLASDYANLAGALQTLDGQIDFTIIYPNGGSAASPANVAVNSRYVMANPFAGFHIICQAEVRFDGVWAPTGWYSDPTYALGVAASSYDDSQIIVQTGRTGLLTTNAYDSSSPFPGSVPKPSALPCRVKVWKVKGAIA